MGWINLFEGIIGKMDFKLSSHVLFAVSIEHWDSWIGRRSVFVWYGNYNSRNKWWDVEEVNFVMGWSIFFILKWSMAFSFVSSFFFFFFYWLGWSQVNLWIFWDKSLFGLVKRKLFILKLKKFIKNYLFINFLKESNFFYEK